MKTTSQPKEITIKEVLMFLILASLVMLLVAISKHLVLAGIGSFVLFCSVASWFSNEATQKNISWKSRAKHAIVGSGMLIMTLYGFSTSKETESENVTTTTAARPRESRPGDMNGRNVVEASYIKEDRSKLSKEDREFLEYNDKLLERGREVSELKQQFERNCMLGGYCMNLAVLVQNEMHDPSTFEHVNTTYRIENDYAIVFMSFRGTNTFGAVVLNRVKAKVSLDCDVISIEKQ